VRRLAPLRLEKFGIASEIADQNYFVDHCPLVDTSDESTKISRHRQELGRRRGSPVGTCRSATIALT